MKKNKSKYIIKYFITTFLIFGLLLSSGCSDLKADNDENTSIGILKLEQSNYENINELLNKQKDVYAITWLSDKNYVAFVKGDTTSLFGQMYIWKVGDKESVLVEGLNDRICELKPSPNDKYYLIDIGTSVSRTNVIFSVRENKEVGRIGVVGMGYWTYDSKYLISASISEIQPIIQTELEGTTDLTLYNIETKEKVILETGTPDYYFLAWEQEDDGTIIYYKKYFKYHDLDEELKYIYKSK